MSGVRSVENVYQDEERIGHVVSDGHAGRCLAFAGYLAARTSESRWGVDVTIGEPSISGHLGRSSIFISWDSAPRYEDFAPTSRYNRNPYIRDVWLSLVEILAECDLHHSNFNASYHRDSPHAPNLRK